VPDVPVQTGPGYTEDPYSEATEGAELDDVLTKFITRIGFGYGGPFSTWRERHIAIAGATAGWRAGTTSLDGKCPPLWASEMQYYEGMWMIANIAKCQWPSVIAGITAITGLLASGIIKIG
jgi:hypothetical protein